MIDLTAVLTQTPTSDTDGNFQLSGTGTFPANPCFSSPVSIASSQVTGGNFTLTYTDNTRGNSVTASGTFSTDGTTLTVTNWTLDWELAGRTPGTRSADQAIAKLRTESGKEGHCVCDGLSYLGSRRQRLGLIERDGWRRSQAGCATILAVTSMPPLRLQFKACGVRMKLRILPKTTPLSVTSASRRL